MVQVRFERHHAGADEPSHGRSREIAAFARVAAGVAVALAGCSYGKDFADCEVSCTETDDDACPDGFSCVAGLCRVDGAGEACQAPGQVTLRQTANDTVERSLEFGCTNPDQTTADGSWYRVFSPAQAGVTGTFAVQTVTVGICFAVGAPSIQVNVGTYGGGAADATLDLAKFQMLASQSQMIEATEISRVVEVPITATIPAGALVLVEVAVPDLDGTGQEINLGFTAGSEMKPGYVRSPLCGPQVPTTTTGAGLPNARLVTTVTGMP